MPHELINVYLAGPDVFFPNAIQRGVEKKNVLKTYNLNGLYPLDNEFHNLTDPQKLGYAIGNANEQLMDKCNIILANLDPWYGPGTDNGTSFEIGYMSAKATSNPDKILIVGYYTKGIPDTFSARVINQIYNNEVHADPQGILFSKDGFMIENFDLQDNLMLMNAIDKTGGEVFGTYEEAASNAMRLWQQKNSSIKMFSTLHKNPFNSFNISPTASIAAAAFMLSATFVLGMVCAAALRSRKSGTSQNATTFKS